MEAGVNVADQRRARVDRTQTSGLVGAAGRGAEKARRTKKGKAPNGKPSDRP